MTAPSTISFSIVTPSFRQPEWLRLCAASVADQRGPGIEVEHIVQDSMSGPEVAAAVSPFPNLRLYSEKDEGMYDAINRGWDKSHGEILAWLNCDEQYLPGALSAVADYFRDHPETDILFADAVVIDKQGDYICSRQVLVPQLCHSWVCHLNTFSSSMFMRRRLMREQGFRLDSQWKDIGDVMLVLDFLRAHIRMDSLDRYLSTFVDTGENRNLQPQARKESRIYKARAPRWMWYLRPVWRTSHRLRRWMKGQYRPKPFSYDIYTPASPMQRVHYEVPQATYFWASRMKIVSHH